MYSNFQTTLNPDYNSALAEELNKEMRSAVLPVTCFVGIETVFGFCGNLMILYVFLFHYHTCNFKYFVLCLSFIDTTSTLTTMPGEIVTQTFWFVYPVPMVCKIKSFFNMFTVCGSAFGLLIIAIDRFRKICRPLNWQIKPKMAMILIFVQFAISFVIALPVAFFWGTNSYQTIYKGHNVTVTVCEKDAKFKHTSYVLEYTIVTEALLSSVMIVMFILYIFICRKLLNGKSTDNSLSNPNFRIRAARYSGGLASDEDLSAQNGRRKKHDTANTEAINVANSDSANITNGSIVNDCRSDDNLNSTKKIGIVTLPSNKSFQRNCSDLADKRTKAKKYLKRMRRKTLIMLILTAVFIVTTVLYLTLLNLIANNILQTLSKTQKSVYFFFFRLYFINHVINPILYGLLDPQFRHILKGTIANFAIKKKTTFYNPG